VYEGVLGCPNCRDGYTITAGFADLRAPPRGPLETGLAGPAPTSGAVGEHVHPAGEGTGGHDEADDALRISALLGIVGGPGAVALVGHPARHAAAVARTSDQLQVVAIDPDLVSWSDAPGVSRAVTAPGLPFFSRTLRGVVVDGRMGRAWIDEAVRVVAPRGRVVVTGAPEWAAEALAAAGLTVLATDAERVVAARG
jgi:hypothetical protein